VQQHSVPIDNHLLAQLTASGRRRLLGDSQPVRMELWDVLSEPGSRLRHAFFPTDGYISLITPELGHRQLEVGLVGNEGMLGVQLLLGVDESPLRAMVQGTGHAWRIERSLLARALERDAPLRRKLDRYLYVFIAQLMQSASCTRFHLIESRLARWLLMTHDRAHSRQFHITHEFLALMLGVRRVGVTRAASALQHRALIRYHRGDISILDLRGLERAACPCYAIDKQTYSMNFKRP
jgi:CRP-like cAMP-binding protein